METQQFAGGQLSTALGQQQGAPVSVVEGALGAFGGMDEWAELPVLAFVPFVNESDLEEPMGLIGIFKEFVRKAIRSWLEKRKLVGHVPMI
jgi:hypothetical protein